MEVKEELYTRAYLGDQADKFWKTDLGEYLIPRIDSEEAGILESLAACEENELKNLQAKLSATRSIAFWFSELINDGQQARQEIEEIE